MKKDTKVSGGFHYSQVDATVADQMRQVADDIRRAADHIQSSTRDSMLEVGKKLLEVKPKIDHGKFTGWVKQECHLHIRTADDS